MPLAPSVVWSAKCVGIGGCAFSPFPAGSGRGSREIRREGRRISFWGGAGSIGERGMKEGKEKRVDPEACDGPARSVD